MEFTAQELGEHRIQTEIARQVRLHFPQTELDRIEARALAKHPSAFRQTVPVSEAVSNIGIKLILERKTPTRKRHVLP